MAYRESLLRDLARKIQEAVRDHGARSQAADILNNVDDHLNALALIEELHARYGLTAAKER
jgi:SLT domain-containing protein